MTARELLLQNSFGVLSTISLDVPGYPFGSVTPYCVDDQCCPLIYISQIAQHTRNILKDPRVSLTIVEGGDSDDVQARGRVTVIANARPLPILPILSIGAPVRPDPRLCIFSSGTRPRSIHRRIRQDLLGGTRRLLNEQPFLAGAGIAHHSTHEPRPQRMRFCTIATANPRR